MSPRPGIVYRNLIFQVATRHIQRLFEVAITFGVYFRDVERVAEATQDIHIDTVVLVEEVQPIVERFCDAFLHFKKYHYYCHALRAEHARIELLPSIHGGMHRTPVFRNIHSRDVTIPPGHHLFRAVSFSSRPFARFLIGKRMTAQYPCMLRCIADYQP